MTPPSLLSMSVIAKLLFAGALLLASLSVRGEFRLLMQRDPRHERTIADFLQDSLPGMSAITQVKAGYTTDAFWVVAEGDFFPGGQLVVANPQVSLLDFYLIRGGRVIREVHTGARRPFWQRDVQASLFLFQLPDTPAPDSRVVMRLAGDAAMLVPIRQIARQETGRFFIRMHGIGMLITGGLLALLVFYFIFFLSLRDWIYGYYLVYALAVILTVMHLNGLLEYLIPAYSYQINRYSSLFETIPAAVGGLFSARFLQLSQYLPRWNRVMMGLIGLQGIALGTTVLGYNQLAMIVTDLIAVIFIPIASVLGYWVWKKFHYTPAKYYLVSWAFVFTGSSVYLMQNHGVVLSDHPLIAHSLELGIGAEMLMLAIAVSKRFEQMRREKEAVQQENLRILEQQNHTLMEFAYANSHRVRGPLARILGLVEVWKITREKPDEVMGRIDQCAQELDDVVKEINHSLKGK